MNAEAAASAGDRRRLSCSGWPARSWGRSSGGWQQQLPPWVQIFHSKSCVGMTNKESVMLDPCLRRLPPLAAPSVTDCSCCCELLPVNLPLRSTPLFKCQVFVMWKTINHFSITISTFNVTYNLWNASVLKCFLLNRLKQTNIYSHKNFF